MKFKFKPCYLKFKPCYLLTEERITIPLDLKLYFINTVKYSYWHVQKNEYALKNQIAYSYIAAIVFLHMNPNILFSFHWFR